MINNTYSNIDSISESRIDMSFLLSDRWESIFMKTSIKSKSRSLKTEPFSIFYRKVKNILLNKNISKIVYREIDNYVKNMSGLWVGNFKNPTQNQIKNPSENSINPNFISLGYEGYMGSHINIIPYNPNEIINKITNDVVNSMRCKTDCFTIGFSNSHYVNVPCWEFSFILPDDPEYIQEVLIVSDNNKPLPLGKTLSFIMNTFDIYSLFTYSEPERFRNGIWPECKNFPGYMNMTLVCHDWKSRLNNFEYDKNMDIISVLNEVHGGLSTFKPMIRKIPVYSVSDHKNYYPVKINLRDVKCFAPDKQKSISSIGKSVNIDIDEDNETLSKVSDSSVSALLYSSELWGYNKEMPITISSASCNAAENILKNVLGCKDSDDFNKKYRGLSYVKSGMINTKNNRLRSVKRLMPLNDDCKELQSIARDSYRGGFNGSFIISFFPFKTYDYDLKNAYLTCMSLIPDVNWEAKRVIINDSREVDIDYNYIQYPFNPTFVYGTFSFPKTVKYPCIPVMDDGCMIFPYESKTSVYMSCPEVYLALKLGASIHAERIICGAVNYDDSFIPARPKRSMSIVAKQFIHGRNEATNNYGKGSLMEILLKTAGNSIYGKTAQNVLDKSDNETMGDSILTSPVLCSLTTAGVRCMIISALNQLNELGYDVYSATTDGFISNATQDVIDSLDLYGFYNLFKAARMELVNNDAVWEKKHEQDDLVNLTTRGNVSLNMGDDTTLPGVIAHNSFKSGYEPDSIEDRLAYVYAAISRTGKVKSIEKRSTQFRDMTRKNNRKNYSVETCERNISMDFDFKRKPIKESIRSVYVKADKEKKVLVKTSSSDSDAFEMAYVDTMPYDNIEEYKKYKEFSEKVNVLRTVNDWKTFFDKMELNDKAPGVRCKDIRKSLLLSSITAYRLSVKLSFLGDRPPVIPFLDRKDIKLKDKLEWINSFNVSDSRFTESDWKNCRRPEYIKAMLPEDMFKNVIVRMIDYAL